MTVAGWNGAVAGGALIGGVLLGSASGLLAWAAVALMTVPVLVAGRVLPARRR